MKNDNFSCININKNEEFEWNIGHLDQFKYQANL